MRNDISNEEQPGLDKLLEASAVLGGLIRNENISIAVVQGIPPSIVLVNCGFAALTGYSEDELMSFGLKDQERLIHPDYRELFLRHYHLSLDGGDQSGFYELGIVRKDGSFRWVSVFANLIMFRGENSVVITLVDITGSKNTEIALRESRERYRLLFERTPAGIFYYDRNLVLTHFNKKFVEIFKSTRKALKGFDFHNINDKSILPCIETAFKGKKGFYEGAYSATTGDAHVVISLRTEPVSGDDGSITGGVGIIEDRTRQYVTEEALLQSERRFKEMIDKSPLPITVMNRDLRIVYANESCLKLYGYNNEDVPDLVTWWERVYPDPVYREKVMGEWLEGYKKAHENGEVFGPSEYKVTSSDGSRHDIEFHVVPLGELAFIIMNDLTRHRKAEAELLRTKKIESLGILAGGIAHDFNNILTAILGNVTLAKMDIAGNDRISEILDIVEKATWRAKDLTQQLLTFSQGGAPVRRSTSVRSLLTDTTNFVLRGTGVRCEFAIPDDLWNADIDEGQISQVIHNIVLNSRQAMNDSGNMLVCAENCSYDAPDIPVAGGDYIRVTIEDDGPGIPEDIMPNVFDPFFTTKSSGSGLGLAVTYSIIKKHGGHIMAFRGTGGGAIIELLLPASREGTRLEKKQDNVLVQSSGRVLVMDDEELVLDICTRMLEKMGYSTARAKDGEEAVRLYREACEAGKRFDCVIMDLTIPGGPGGREVVKILSEYDPGLKAIVSSGYSNDPVMSRYRDYGFVGVSVKPYSFNDLREVVSSAIASSADSSR